MAKLRNKTQGNFTIVNNDILRNTDLGIKERGLLITLLSLPDNWSFSVLGLTKILPDGKDAINATLKKLEQIGYVRRIQAKNESGRFAGYDWEVAEKPFAENPSTEIPSTEIPFTDNPQQSNTNLSRTNQLSINDINPSFIHSEEKEETERTERTRRALLASTIGFEGLKHDSIACDLFELCVEICASQSDIKVNGKKVPNSIFTKRIENLYYEDLLRIAEQIRAQQHQIKNIKQYMIAALYNEHTSSNTYWANRVQVDQYGKASS
jgi:hypothetical protein